jgi:hypothetical protein
MTHMHLNREKHPANAASAIDKAIMARRAQRVAEMPDPDSPGSGTETVAARLAQARLAAARTPRTTPPPTNAQVTPTGRDPRP